MGAAGRQAGRLCIIEGAFGSDRGQGSGPRKTIVSRVGDRDRDRSMVRDWKADAT